MSDENISLNDPPILIARGLALDRRNGERVLALGPPGFGNESFGDGLFGWD
jgi:hypothetical protein